MSDETDVGRLLRRANSGDTEARNELFPLVYGELRGLARYHMRGQNAAHTLQPTALVNEAYLRLCRDDGASWTDRGHFFRLASTVMRQILVDSARRRTSLKRGGGATRVELDAALDQFEARSGGVIALDEALDSLAQRFPDLAEFVELRFFGGLAVEEVAQVLGVSSRSATRMWRTARAFLQRELDHE